MNRTSNETLRAFCITVGGSGYAPIASGTWGSLAALLPFGVLWLAVLAAGGGRWIVELVTVGGVILSSWLSIRWGLWAIQRYPTRKAHKHDDPSEFVLDEFAGQWVALVALPLALGADWWSLLVVIGGQFLLFRFFDIAKLPPAKQCEKLHAGWGILVDDLWAGAYANIVGQILWRLTPLAGWLGVNVSGG